MSNGSKLTSDLKTIPNLSICSWRFEEVSSLELSGFALCKIAHRSQREVLVHSRGTVAALIGGYRSPHTGRCRLHRQAPVLQRCCKNPGPHDELLQFFSVNHSMPNPPSTNRLHCTFWNYFSDKRPVILIELPYLLPDVSKGLEKVRRFGCIVDSRQRAQRSVSVHADPFFFGDFFSRQDSAMLFQLPSVESSDSGYDLWHEFGQKQQSEQFP